MHQGNVDFLIDVSKRFHDLLSGSVLELGSFEWDGGSSRKCINNAARYVGVDKQAGPGVDVVCEAIETRFEPGEFDALVCLSMFEHDAGWKESLAHNLQWIKEGGLIILGWGAEGNLMHPPYPWKPVPVAEFMAAAKRMPIELVEAFFEKRKYTPDCEGAYDVIARKRSQ
jgi:SAM-dependent methyltransferase